MKPATHIMIQDKLGEFFDQYYDEHLPITENRKVILNGKSYRCLSVTYDLDINTLEVVLTSKD